jgi:hypothetical protein
MPTDTSNALRYMLFVSGSTGKAFDLLSTCQVQDRILGVEHISPLILNL